MSPKKRILLAKIAWRSVGEPATPSATAAVTPRPTNIQP